MFRTTIVSLFAMVSLSPWLPSQHAKPQPIKPDLTGQNPPNIVLILDGTSRAILEQPTLDAALPELSRAAQRFPRCYLGPITSTNHASFLTGRYHIRTKCISDGSGWSMVATDEVTLAEALGGAGYNTGFFGKWHIGNQFPMRPTDQGFHSSTTLAFGDRSIRTAPDPSNAETIWLRNNHEASRNGHIIQTCFEEAAKFIKDSKVKHRPFFCMISAPATPSDEDGPQKIIEGVRSISKILSEVSATDNTMVIMVADSPSDQTYTTPLIIKWPKDADPLQITPDSPIAHIDIMPTIMAACGLGTPEALEFDGINLAGEEINRQNKNIGDQRNLYIQWNSNGRPLKGRNFLVANSKWLLRVASSEKSPQATPVLTPVAAAGNSVASEQEKTVKSLMDDYGSWFDDVTYTRIRDRGPAHILIDRVSENPVFLTATDRVSSAPTFSSPGYWNTSFQHAGRMDVTVYPPSLKDQSLQNWKATIQIRRTAYTQTVSSSATPITFRGIAVTPGNKALRAKFTSPDGNKEIFALQTQITHR